MSGKLVSTEHKGWKCVCVSIYLCTFGGGFVEVQLGFLQYSRLEVLQLQLHSHVQDTQG